MDIPTSLVTDILDIKIRKKLKIKKLMVLSKTLDPVAIIENAFYLLHKISERYEDGYAIYFVPPEKSNEKIKILNLRAGLHKAQKNEIHQNDNESPMEVIITQRSELRKELEAIENFLLKQLGLTEIAYEIIINLALIIYREHLYYSKKKNYRIFMADPDSNKIIYKFNWE